MSTVAEAPDDRAAEPSCPPSPTSHSPTCRPSKAPARLRPSDHGRRMAFEDFIRCDFEDGCLYELARGVIVVTEVPGIHHGLIVQRTSRLSSPSTTRLIPASSTIAPAGANAASACPACDPIAIPTWPSISPAARRRPEALDPLDPRPRRRGRLRGRRGARLRREARGIPPRRRPRILDPEPVHPRPPRPPAGRRRLAGSRPSPPTASIAARSCPAWKSGPPTSSARPTSPRRPFRCSLDTARLGAATMPSPDRAP